MVRDMFFPDLKSTSPSRPPFILHAETEGIYHGVYRRLAINMCIFQVVNLLYPVLFHFIS